MNLARQQVAQQRSAKRMIVAPKAQPAPNQGWVSAQNLAAMAPGTCLKCINAFPTTTGVRVRGGNSLHATLNLDTPPEPVESLMNYVGASGAQQMFGSCDGDIFPITTVADPEIVPTPDVTGQTSDYYAFQNFATSGGYYMYAVNGTDDPELFDGTIWTAIDGASVPAITGVTTSTFSHVNVFRNRLYFVEKGSLRVWYLPVDSIGGAANSLSLAGVFREGGSVYFTATWSSESGSSSLNDYLVVVSTLGEFAVYQGDYPGGTWVLAGVYELGIPLGINGWFKAGGDIVVATERGLIPISAARFKDPAALSMDAISKDIHPDWVREAAARRAVPWECLKWDEKTALYINVPVVSASTPPRPFVANLQTGKWAEWSAWDTRCMVVHNRQLYFGCNDGTVRAAEVSGYDYPEQPYTFQVAQAWDHLGNPGNIKTVRQAKATFLATRPFNVLLSASTDYAQQFPNPPNVLADNDPSSLFDVGLFDVALWDDGEVAVYVTTRWQSIGRSGEIFSMETQIPIGNDNTPNIEMTLLLWTAEQGNLVV